MLKLAKNLKLPLAAVTEVFAFLGKRGGGKTYGAMKLAEEILFNKAQLIAFDVVGKWYGLRIPKDKRNAPFDIVIFGGLHGDVEINPKAGKIVAQAVLTKNLSAVLDISQFIHSEQVRFMYDFLVELFEYRKKHPAACHIVFEEAQELIPQNLPPKEGENYAARLLSIGNRVIKLGRNYGIGVTLIAQRPQEVNKKVLNMAEILFAYQMVGLQEKDTVKEWTQSKGDDTDVKDLLPRLKNGEALVFSPTYLEKSGTYKVDEKITADVSATPKVGVDATQSQKLEPRDVRELTESISALTTEMEANTPAALKKRIDELEKLLREIPKATSQTVDVHVPVLDEQGLNKLQDAVTTMLDRWREMGQKISDSFNKFVMLEAGPVTKLLADLRNAKPELPGGLKSAALVKKIPTDYKTRTKSAVPYANVAQNSPSNEGKKHAQPAGDIGISRPQQKILNVLASFEPLGLTSLTRSNLAVFADVSPKSSSFANNLGTLRNTSGLLGPDPLIEYLAGGHVKLTHAGRAFADGSEFSASTNKDLLEAWCRKLSGPQGKILRELFVMYPEDLSRSVLAGRVDVSENSSSYANNLGSLRSLGLIDYGPNKTVFATDLLFPFD